MLLRCLLMSALTAFGQSTSVNTYMNPVIPGDHPDCTLRRIGSDFYTTGSSFNPTPVIYHSTDSGPLGGDRSARQLLLGELWGRLKPSTHRVALARSRTSRI